MTALERYKSWLAAPWLDEASKKELADLTDEKEIEKYEWLSSEKAKAILPYWYTPIIEKTENLLKQKGVCFNAKTKHF